MGSPAFVSGSRPPVTNLWITVATLQMVLKLSREVDRATTVPGVKRGEWLQRIRLSVLSGKKPMRHNVPRRVTWYPWTVT